MSSALEKASDYVKIGLGKLFGDYDDDVTEEELEEIASEVTERLKSEVKAEFRKKADDLKTTRQESD